MVSAFGMSAERFLERLQQSSVGAAVLKAHDDELRAARAETLAELAKANGAWQKAEQSFAKDAEAARLAVVEARRVLREALDGAGRVKGARNRALRDHNVVVEQLESQLRATPPRGLVDARLEISREVQELHLLPQRSPVQAARLHALQEAAKQLARAELLPDKECDDLVRREREALPRRVRLTLAYHEVKAARQRFSLKLSGSPTDRQKRTYQALLTAENELRSIEPSAPKFDELYTKAVAPIRAEVRVP